MLMEAGESQDPHLAGCRPRGAGGVSSSLNACRLETQEEKMFQFESKGRKRWMSQFKAVRQEEIRLIKEVQPFCSSQAFN